MSLGQPAAPNPLLTAEAQQGLNTQSAAEQAAINNVNQVTPYGSLTYSQTGTGPNGVPTYTATQTLSPQEQGLLNATLGTQQTIASDAGQLAQNLGPSLTNAPDLSNDALVKQLQQWQTNYMTPYYNMQTSNLQSQLANQGITQGSQAWNNAMMQLQQTQNASQQNAMAGNEAQAYQQALSTYQAPIQTLGTLLGEGSPASLNSSLTSTPQEQIQPANYQSLAEQNYQNQNQQYGNTMSGLFSIPSAVLGGWARSGFPGVSDRRKKKDIAQVGTLFDGTPVYRFRYLHENEMRIGVMAQDILDDMPEAIVYGHDGTLMVDYEAATARALSMNHNV